MSRAAHRVILVGAGAMGSNHARVIAQSHRAELTAVVDVSEKTGRALAERVGSTWLPELPDLDDVDAVVVAAATEAHPAIAELVLENDTALLLEKPIAAGLRQTEQIIDLAERRDVPLFCGLLERFNPAIVTAQQFIQEPFHVNATRHSPYAPRIRTGVSWDLLVHDVDLAIRIMGSAPADVTARRAFIRADSVDGAEDVAETLLTFAGGAIAQISASRVGQRKIRQLSVYEPERLVEIDLLRRDVTIYHHVSESGEDGRGYKQQTVIEIPENVVAAEPLTAQFDAFLDTVEGARDAAAERATLLPAHRVIDQVIAA